MFSLWLLLIKWAGKGSATAEFHHNYGKVWISNSLKLTEENFKYSLSYNRRLNKRYLLSIVYQYSNNWFIALQIPHQRFQLLRLQLVALFATLNISRVIVIHKDIESNWLIFLVRMKWHNYNRWEPWNNFYLVQKVSTYSL